MLTKLKTSLERALAALTSFMLAVMVCLMLWQVFTRYVLQTPALFTEEMLRFTMIWMALLGSAYCFGRRKHLSLVFVLEALPPAKRRVFFIINDVIVLCFAFFILFLGGIRAVESTMQQFSPILRIPMGYVYLILPITAVLIFILQSLNTIEFIRHGDKPQAPQKTS